MPSNTKKDKKKPLPAEELGTGMASKAGEALSRKRKSRMQQIEAMTTGRRARRDQQRKDEK